MSRFPLFPALRPLVALALLLFAAAAHAWPQIPSQNVGLGAQSAYSDHGNAACEDGLGGTFVAWTDVRGPQHVYVQHLDSTGAVVAGWPAEGLDVSPSDTSPWAQCDVLGIFPCGTGSAIVAWIDWDIPWSSHSPFWAQRVADPAAGGLTLWTAGGVQVTNPPGGWEFDNVQANACAGDSNTVLIAYTFSGSHTRLQKLRPDGSRAFGNYGAFAHLSDFYWDTDGPDWNPRTAPDGQGGAFVIWEDIRNSLDWETAIQHIGADGEVASGWPEDGIVLSVDPVHDDPWMPPNSAFSMVTPDGFGGAIVTWNDLTATHGYLQGQRVAADGTLLWDQTANGGTAYVNFHLAEDWDMPHTMCPDGAGGAYYARATTRAHLLHITAGGYDDWMLDLGSMDYSNYGAAPDVIPDGLGGALVAWEATWTAGGSDIQTQHVDIHGNVLQGESGVLLTDDPYAQHSAKIARDGGVGGIVNWIDARPAVFEALPPLAPLAGSPANAIPPDGKRKTSTRRNGAPARHAPLQPSGSTAGMFAQQVNSAGVLGGPVIYSYIPTTGVAPTEHDGALAVLGGAPNPAVGRMRIAFTLPTGDAASLEVLDVSGRRVWSSDVGTLGAGRHVADLGGTNGAAPGLYFVRLRQAGRIATGKVLLTR